MSLKATETVYNLVIDHVIKEITDDPQLNSISTEAIEYLGKVWRTKLHDTGVFTPPNTDYQKHLVTHHQLPLLRPAMPDNYLQNIAAAASSTGDPNLARMMMRPPGAYGGEYVPDPGVWLPPYYPRVPNIQYDAKPMLASGTQQAYPQQLLHQQMMGQMQANQQHMMNMNMAMNPNQQMQKKEPAKNTINIKAEPNRDEEEQANNSKVPTKVPVQGPGQGLIDISTPKRSMNNTEVSTPLHAKENQEKEAAKHQKPHHEEEKKDNVFHSDEDDDHEHEDDNNNQEEDEDDAALFEYDAADKGDIPQPKEEHIPPPLQQGNAIAQVPLNLADLDPYNPQDRPLDSDDDPDYGETPETTDILIAFHEKTWHKVEGDVETGNNERKRQGIYFEPDNGRFRFHVRSIVKEPSCAVFVGERRSYSLMLTKEKEEKRQIYLYAGGI